MHNPLLLTGHVYEFRAPNGRKGTYSGYFETGDALYQAAANFDDDLPGLYVTMNPVKPALLARAHNRIQSYAKTTTSDADIVQRCWLLVDCDAVRPADISSTDAEHQAAIDRTGCITDWLTAQGWPEPVRADSGNGGHLLYRIDLPNDSASRDLVKAVLEALALRFNDAQVVIDTSVFNAARITKLYGTMVRKGDSTLDRPHRQSTILHAPESLSAVSREQLQRIAALRPAEPKPLHPSVSGNRFDLQEFIARHGLEVAREKSWNGATVFELAQCPFNPEHVRDSSIIQFPSGAVAFQCFHNSCQAHRWQDLRTRLEPDRARALMASPREPSVGQMQPTELRLVSADTVVMRPVKWTIQGRVPLGMLTVLAGRGGLGKSTLAIDWAAQLTHGKAAGALAGQPCNVIVSSTEDTESETLTPRLTAADADLAKIHFIHLTRGGVDGSLAIPDDITMLRQAVQQAGAKMVIIDPLMSHLSSTLNAWNDQEIRQALTPLSRLAEECEVSILVLAHLNKDSKKEAIDRIGGSVGISNTARSVLFAGSDPDDPEGVVKMLAHPKCNVGPSAPTLRYRTETVHLTTSEAIIETTRIVWEGEAPGITADDLAAKSDPVSREDRELAVAWLEKTLPVGTRRKQTDLEAEALQKGIKPWSLRKARTALKVKTKKEGFRQGGWVWWRDEDANNIPQLSSSGKTSPKPLIFVKVREDASSHSFDTSSALEDARKLQSHIFDASSNISTTYKTLSTQDARAGSYIEEVDLRAD